MKKVFFMILALLILCGCSSEYNLIIENDKITEDINIVIPKDYFPDYSNVDPNNFVNPDEYVEPDDQLTPFLKNDQYAVGNNRYIKEVTEDDKNYYVELNYTYTAEEFKNGRAVSRCFENATYENHDEYYLINLSGQFYCLYGEELVINVNTKNIVEDCNADKVSGNKYTWTINNDNVRNTNITLKVLKRTKTERYAMIGSVIAIVAVIATVAFIVIRNITIGKKENEI